MFQEVISACTSPQNWDWKIVTLIAILLPFVYTYLSTSWAALQAYDITKRQPYGQKHASNLPYAIPFLGHLFPFITDGGSFLSQAAKRYGLGTPIKVLLAPGLSRYLITGPDMVSAFFRETYALSGKLDELTMLENALGCPRHSVEFYGADDSGYAATPLPESVVEPENRTFYINHKMVNSYLSGTSLKGMTERFQENLAKQIQEDESIGDGWVEISDLFEFMQIQVMSAAIKSMFGNYLLDLNPSFIHDFWAWNGKVGKLFMSIPRWLDPQAYILRSKMLTSIKRWHNYAHEHFDGNKLEQDVEWEPYFGSKFSRARQSKFLEWTEFDETARAASDLGIIWGSNANSVTAAAWFLYEILRDPVLKSNIRTELATAALPPTSPTSVPLFDIVKLCTGPRLQSVYAETLRLRVAVLVSRQVQTTDLQLNGWQFKNGENLAAASSIEAQNENVWSQGGEGNPHPLNQFWAERFLVYPHDPRSGPLKQPKASRSASTAKSDTQEKVTGPRFSLEGLSTAWIPYSGGIRICPGRHFAKQEIISASALLLSAYDIELIEPGKKINVNNDYYGFGAMPPKQKIRCRIKRRTSKLHP